MKTMPVTPQYLRASAVGRPVGVDRKKELLLGYVVAQEGPFKSYGRGEFDVPALRELVKLGNDSRGGLKSRFTHPDLSGDGLGKHLGRAKDFTLSSATDRKGRKVSAVRADLHFDASAHDTPSGDLSGYVMTLAENDPDALSSSIVVVADEEYRLKKDGTPEVDEDGELLPPLWRPKELHASDIVDTGDAVDGLLSVPQWQDLLHWDNTVRLASQALDHLFRDQPREVVEARVRDYLARYLSRRYGEAPPPAPTPKLSAFEDRMAAMAAAVAKYAGKKVNQ
jgi:hypothetical protein